MTNTTTALKNEKLAAVRKSCVGTPRITSRIENGNRVAVLFRGRWELYTVEDGLEMFVRFVDSFDAFAWVYA